MWDLGTMILGASQGIIINATITGGLVGGALMVTSTRVITLGMEDNVYQLDVTTIQN